MKKAVIYLLIFALAIITVKPCIAESSNSDLKRAVVTFSPLIVNNQNCTHKLFEAISKLLEKESYLSKTLEASGAFWSVSSNLCGIQICINWSKSLDELKEIVSDLLSKCLDKLEGVFSESNGEIFPINRLYKFFVDTQSSAFAKEPITIGFYDTTGSEITLEEVVQEEPLLAKELNRGKELYRRWEESNVNDPLIQNITKPILAKFLIWNELTPDSFISASLIKNRLFYDSENDKKYSAELLNTGKGLAVAILCEGEEGSLYEHYLQMRNRVEFAVSGIGSEEWQSWSSKLLRAMESDRRDPGKNAMFSAWLKHWQAEGFSEIPDSASFKKADYEKEVEVFSSLEKYSFKLSANAFPAIYAYGSDSKRDFGAYVAVCFEGRDEIIDSIEKYVGTNFKANIPITLIRQSPSLIILSLYSQIEQVPTSLSRLKSSVTEFLYKDLGVMELKQSVSIGVAGVSHIPAYRLQGLLKLGWATNPSLYPTRAVTASELYTLVQKDSSDEEILKRRWKNLIFSPRIKANILSILACRNLAISSWEP